MSSREWGGYPIIAFTEVPEIDVLMMHRPDQPPLGAGESASVPGAAAIANAIFDATGVRFRSAPFTAERDPRGAGPPARHAAAGCGERRRWFGKLAGLGAALGVAAVGLLGLHPAIRRHGAPGRRRVLRRPDRDGAAAGGGSGTVPGATPPLAARPTPAATRCTRRSAPSTPPT